MGKVAVIKGADFSENSLDKHSSTKVIDLVVLSTIAKAYPNYSSSGGTGVLTTHNNQTSLVFMGIKSGDKITITSTKGYGTAAVSPCAFRYAIYSSVPSIGDVALEGGFTGDSFDIPFVYDCKNDGYLVVSVLNQENKYTTYIDVQGYITRG